MIGWRNSLGQNLEARRCRLNAKPLSVARATVAADLRHHNRLVF
jgi:hypothetical protein